MNEPPDTIGIVPLDEYESGQYVSQGSYESFLPSPVIKVVRETIRTSARCLAVTQAFIQRGESRVVFQGCFEAATGCEQLGIVAAATMYLKTNGAPVR